MGIDVYMRWPKQSRQEKDAQLCGFSIDAGDVGYLREAYHGGPYVTRFLVKAAFDSEDAQATIPAATMRQRLPAAVFLSLYRDQSVYGEGRAPGIIEIEDADEATDVLTKLVVKALGEAKGSNELEIAAHLNEEQLRACRKMIDDGNLGPTQKAFVDFVELAERKEKETGEPVTVIASY